MSIKVNGKVVSGGPGKKGEDGKSAYQYAVDGGYTGTEEDFQELMGSGPWLPLSGGILTPLSPNKVNLTQSMPSITFGGAYTRSTVEGWLYPAIFFSPNFSSYGFSALEFNYVSGDGQSKPYLRMCLAKSNAVVSPSSQIILNGIKAPTQDAHAANKKYVDDSIKTAIDSSWAKAY